MSPVDLEILVSMFVTLLVIMDPPGILPVFLGLTKSLTHRQRVAAARRAALVALGVITAFGVFGQQILQYLHISLPALQGAGGLPMGVQLVGPRHGDARLLRTARWLTERVAAG